MNSRQLDCFITLAEQKNFSQTSRLLFTTQSVVSYQMMKLEEELGFQLFIRDTHNVILTRAGENFYQVMVNLKEQYQQAVVDSYNLDRAEKNMLKISWQVFEVATLLGALIATYHEKYPDIQLELTSQSGSDYLEDLVSMRKDLIFIYEENLRPDPRVTFIHFWTVNNYLVMNVKNPLAAKEHIEVEDLEGQVIFVPLFTPHTRTANEVYSAIIKRFPDADIRLLSDFDITSIPQVIANHGLALYPAPRYSMELGLVSRPFGHCTPMEIGIACRSDDQSLKVETAIEMIKKIFSNMVNH